MDKKSTLSESWWNLWKNLWAQVKEATATKPEEPSLPLTNADGVPVKPPKPKKRRRRKTARVSSGRGS